MVFIGRWYSQQVKRTLLVDGTPLLIRAYHGSSKDLQTSKGVKIGGVYTYINMLLKLAPIGMYDYIGVFFDPPRKDNFRSKEIDGNYKAHRQPLPEDLVIQFPMAIDVTKRMGIHTEVHKKYEADDLIASYCRLALEENNQVYIATGDKDLYQLITDNSFILPLAGDEIVDKEACKNKLGVIPKEIVTLLTLTGDQSDNIKGVPGVGLQTAKKLIEEFGTIESIIENVNRINNKRIQQAIVSNLNSIKRDLSLVQLHNDVNEHQLSKLKSPRKYERKRFLSFLEEHEMNSVIKRIHKQEAKTPSGSAYSVEQVNNELFDGYRLIQNMKDLNTWIQEAKKKGEVSFSCLISNSVKHEDSLVGIALTHSPKNAIYVPLLHGFEDDISKAESLRLLKDYPQLELLKREIFENLDLKVIAHDVKQQIKILNPYGIKVKSFDDTMVMSYVLHCGACKQEMPDLMETVLGINDPKGTVLIDKKIVLGIGKSRKSFLNAPLIGVSNFACQNPDFTMRLYQKLKPLLEKERNLLTFYQKLEKPLVKALAAMEIHGAYVNIDEFHRLEKDYEKKIDVIREEILELAGIPGLNINSNQQVGEALFDILKLDKKFAKKSPKSGQYVLNNEILTGLGKSGYDIANKILDYRGLCKLYSVYIHGLRQHINPYTKRIHPTYTNCLTVTGRLSCAEPNLQNIPNRTEEGRGIRKLFVAPPGCVLMKVDYSQVELRILAHVARIPSLREAFLKGADIHSTTAASIFGKPLESVEKSERQKAKSINFGIIYGMSEYGLSKQIGVSVENARDYIKAYFKQYPGIRKYMDGCISFVEKHGYVNTFFGRRCYVPGIKAKNRNEKSFAERTAINTPIQGSSADITKMAMVRLHKIIKDRNMKTRMIMQVHDEIVFEVPVEEKDVAAKIIRETMERAAEDLGKKFSIPLPVDVTICQSWSE